VFATWRIILLYGCAPLALVSTRSGCFTGRAGAAGNVLAPVEPPTAGPQFPELWDTTFGGPFLESMVVRAEEVPA